jgi:large subunit ribosomal protein L14
MIIPGARLKVIDNSGARVVECIGFLGGIKCGRPGAIMTVTVKSINPRKRLKKGSIQRAVLVSTAKEVVRSNGFFVSFGQSCAVVVTNKNVPLATRILAPIMLEVRGRGLFKVVSMSAFTV